MATRIELTEINRPYITGYSTGNRAVCVAVDFKFWSSPDGRVNRVYLQGIASNGGGTYTIGYLDGDGYHQQGRECGARNADCSTRQMFDQRAEVMAAAREILGNGGKTSNVAAIEYTCQECGAILNRPYCSECQDPAMIVAR